MPLIEKPRCEQCTFSQSDWRHTILCGSLTEEQEHALAKLVVLDAKAQGKLPPSKEMIE